MIHQNTHMALAPLTSSTIAVLRCTDRFVIDPVPLAVLYAEMPEHAAEEIVCSALEDIARRIDSLQTNLNAGDFSQMPRITGRIGAVAKQIGLISIAESADHVAVAAAGGNAVALGATLARLERAFDAAVSDVWAFRKHLNK